MDKHSIRPYYGQNLSTLLLSSHVTENFTHVLIGVFFTRFYDSKFPQVSKTFLSGLADLNSVLV